MISVDLYDTLQQTWQALCADYDVTADLPDWDILFDGVDLAVPSVAARTVLANMLAEVVEGVGRFSPWYRQSAAVFGLTIDSAGGTRRPRWTLRPEIEVLRRDDLDALTYAIDRNWGVILATHVVGEVNERALSDDPCVVASCRCQPPRSILVQQSVIISTQIICDACHQPFS